MENNSQKNEENPKKEESIFSGEEFSLEGYDKHIKQARNALYFAAGLLGLGLILTMFVYSDNEEYHWLDIVLYGIFITGFILLGAWTKKKPYYAIIGGLCLFGAFILLNALARSNYCIERHHCKDYHHRCTGEGPQGCQGCAGNERPVKQITNLRKQYLLL